MKTFFFYFSSRSYIKKPTFARSKSNLHYEAFWVYVLYLILVNNEPWHLNDFVFLGQFHVGYRDMHSAESFLICFEMKLLGFFDKIKSIFQVISYVYRIYTFYLCEFTFHL